MTSRIFTIFLVLFVSCGRHYLAVNKVKVDRDSLASTFVGSPDPRQDNPPQGEKLYISWFLPDAWSSGNYTITLQVIYRDLSEESTSYPTHSPTGVVNFPLLGEKFIRTRGFYSYKATLLDGEWLK